MHRRGVACTSAAHLPVVALDDGVALGARRVPLASRGRTGRNSAMRWMLAVSLLLSFPCGDAGGGLGRTTAAGPSRSATRPLTQITPANVASLKVAWTYETRDAFPGSEMQCQPVVAHGVLYATSPRLRVFALDAATGAVKWSFDPQRGREDAVAHAHPRADVLGAGRAIAASTSARATGSTRSTRTRASRWRASARTAASICARASGTRPAHPERRREHARRVLRRPADPRIDRARRAAVGARRHPRLRRPHRRAEVGLPHHPASGRVRLRHVAEGRLEVQRRRQRLGGAVASTDARAGVRRHRVGGLRLLRRQPARRQPLREHHPVPPRGYRRARVALPGRQTRRLGPRLPAPPALITITRDGRSHDVVAQIAKNGRTYVLDRETGEPVFPMEEVAVPASDVPGERLSATQVVPTLPPPFTRQRFTEDLITTRTPAAHAAVREKWLKLRKARRVRSAKPPGHGPVPGHGRRRRVGRRRVRPDAGLLYVNANEMAWTVALAERKMPDGERRDRQGRSTSGTARPATARTCAAPRRSSPRSSASASGGASTRSPRSSARAAAACLATPSCTAPCVAPSCSTW